MEMQQDFKELLALFDARGVEYLVIGAHALAFHGAPRYTGDLDILINPEPENARRILSALAEFGFGSLDITEKDFEKPDNVVQLGMPPVRIDILTSISGVSWDSAYSGRAEGEVEGVRVYYIGREDLIANKRAAGRKRDLADLEALGAE